MSGIGSLITFQGLTQGVLQTAAAVIPAPIAYIKVVAVKKLVVGFLAGSRCPCDTCADTPCHPSVNPPDLNCSVGCPDILP